MYCMQCGKQIPDDSVFCSKCGAQQTATTVLSAVAPPEITTPDAQTERVPTMPNLFACPHCGQTDQVQKATSVVGHGTTDSVMHSVKSASPTTIGLAGRNVFVGKSFGGRKSTTQGGTQSRLAQRLSPPSEPTYQRPWSALTIFMIAALIYLPLSQLAHDNPRSGWGSGIIFFPVAAIMIWRKVKETKKRHAIYDREHPRWENAASRWLQLFYCFRCDGVFLSSEQEFVPSSIINYILYK